MAILTICTLLLAVVTLLPLHRSSHWTIRGLDFPRLQFTIFAATLLIAHFLFLDIHRPLSLILITVTIAFLVWQAGWICPYTRLWPHEVEASNDSCSARQISILTANVLTSNRNTAALIDLAVTHKPDVLVTMESDHWWEDQLRGLQSEMPYVIECPLDNLYGMHVYSRLPLSDTEVRFITQPDVPSIHTAIELRSGDKIRAHFLHPAPPSPTENPESAERDTELIAVARSVAEADLPVIVAGDLNDVAWSATTRLFRKISGLLDPRVGRGIFNTFHVDYPMFRWPLDHLFHSRHFTLLDIQRLPTIDSDHFPMLTKLSFTPTQGEHQSGPEASASDEDWAHDIVDKQNLNASDVPRPGENSG